MSDLKDLLNLAEKAKELTLTGDTLAPESELFRGSDTVRIVK